MKKNTLLFIVFSFLSTIIPSNVGLFSQNLIKGYVYNADTYEPISDVKINSTNSEKTTTNKKGYFEINTTNQSDTLTFKMVGFDTISSFCSSDKDVFILLKNRLEELAEVQINAYNSNQTSQKTAGAITVLKAKDLQQGNGMSMQSALNSVPGVRMDQSTLSDARISIRGSGVRSPWGIRDVKIYINDIPLTEADGTSRIEGLDLHDLGKTEIVRGPASSMYGGGVAGVILFSMEKTPYREHSIELNGLYGSYGLARVSGIYRYSDKTINSYVSYGQQWYKGYREHSEDKRNFITGNFQFYPSIKRKITLLINRTGQKSQIPGALNEEQVSENRKQANSTNLDKNARRDEVWTRIGIGQNYQFNDKLSNVSSIFTYFYDLDHPLPYAVLQNAYQSVGGRTRFNYQPGFRILDTKFTLGMEINYATAHPNQFVNNHGETGLIMSSQRNQMMVYALFFQSNTQLASNTFLSLGVNYSGISYSIRDFLNSNESGVKKFNPQASPRITISQHINDRMSLHGSVSMGYSPPTSSEISNIDGSINQNLQAQNAINYEINAKGKLFHSHFNYELSFYKMDMRGELIGRSPVQGITVYENAGKTNHEGIEFGGKYLLIRENDSKIIHHLLIQSAITYSHFRFKEYSKRDAQNQVTESFNGNQLTGIPPWTISAGLEIEMQMGFYLNANFFYNDKIPLNDANTVYNKSWYTLNLKIGYSHLFWKHFALDVYAGMDNATNTKYSSYVVLNAISYNSNSPAYFNPSPERSFYTGISLKYLINQ